MQQGKKLHDDQAISIETGINIMVYGHRWCAWPGVRCSERLYLTILKTGGLWLPVFAYRDIK